jgi:hypothetical protein
MAKMWTGPCKELIDSYTDKLASRLHRRASKLGISYTAAFDGRSAKVERFEKQGAGYVFTPIGEATGSDVPNLWLNIHLQFTPIDAELVEIASAMVLRRAEAVAAEVRSFFTRVERQPDELFGVISNVRS